MASVGIGQAARDEVLLAAVEMSEMLTTMAVEGRTEVGEVLIAMTNGHTAMLNAALRAIDRLEERIEQIELTG